jgi:hypothetical protein
MARLVDETVGDGYGEEVRGRVSLVPGVTLAHSVRDIAHQVWPGAAAVFSDGWVGPSVAEGGRRLADILVETSPKGVRLVEVGSGTGAVGLSLAALPDTPWTSIVVTDLDTVVPDLEQAAAGAAAALAVPVTVEPLHFGTAGTGAEHLLLGVEIVYRDVSPDDVCYTLATSIVPRGGSAVVVWQPHDPASAAAWAAACPRYFRRVGHLATLGNMRALRLADPDPEGCSRHVG